MKKTWTDEQLQDLRRRLEEHARQCREALSRYDSRPELPADLRDLRSASLDLARLDGARLDGASLDGASLDGARLDGASLVRASLVRARLDGASLDGARLDGASLDGARLDGASLDGASLVRARLDCARLDGASLDGASLVRARLDGASLDGARLDGASLDGARLPHFTHVPEDGAFVAWKAGEQHIVKLLIPEDAQRTSSLVGRKCRASKAVVIGIYATNGAAAPPEAAALSKWRTKLRYVVGQPVEPDGYDPDPRVECSNGVHFFVSLREAIEYGDWGLDSDGVLALAEKIRAVPVTAT